MFTSFGKEVGKVYRLQITCPAGHTTYIDYATRKACHRNYHKLQDKTTWHAYRIDILTDSAMHPMGS